MLFHRDSEAGVTIDIDDLALSQKFIVACLLAIAIYNAFEMLPIIYFTFSRYSGLYFWSMIAADLGVLVYATGFVMNNFQLTGNQTLPTVLTCAAWIPMVSAQSLILYSRLRLINVDETVRRCVLAMILFNGITMHTGTAITTIGSNGKAAKLFLEPYAIMERIQVTVFFVQELILSGLYVYKARWFLKTYRHRDDKGSRAQRKLTSMMHHLILSSVVVVVLDITILVLEYMGLYFLQVSYKAFVYSVKLKCEVGILNRLVDFVKSVTAIRSPQGGPNCAQHNGGFGKSPFYHSFELTSQVEREWEMTLRNTFGGPVAREEKRGRGGDHGVLVEGDGEAAGALLLRPEQDGDGGKDGCSLESAHSGPPFTWSGVESSGSVRDSGATGLALTTSASRLTGDVPEGQDGDGVSIRKPAASHTRSSFGSVR